MQTIVIGAGVIGLSSGVALLEAGLGPVVIWARELPPHTTSDVAAAIWYPYRADPPERVLHWSKATFHELVALSRLEETGVRLCEGLELFRAPAPDPWWREAVPRLRRTESRELPPGYSDGYRLTVPVLEMPVYLPWLRQRFESLGGRIEQRDVERLAEALAEADTVVLCAGLGARELARDKEVYPVRGQVLRVLRPADLDRFLIDEHDPAGVTYIIPRTHDCVLGGTAEQDDESLKADEAAAVAIRERCVALEPRLKHADLLAVAVGVRPCRSSVRLEAERPGEGKLLVHNYGHGGAGVTLSWGCAREVAGLVRAARL
jgi:D-amino-acid oxidase